MSAIVETVCSECNAEYITEIPAIRDTIKTICPECRTHNEIKIESDDKENE